MRTPSPTVVRLALVMEMHLFLGPASIAALVALTPAALLGFPQALGLIVGPVARWDIPTLALMGALPLAIFALPTFWSLGCITAARKVYRFNGGFWLAVVCGVLSSAVVATVVGPVAAAGALPAWLFLLHMALLQWRIRAAARSRL